MIVSSKNQLVAQFTEGATQFQMIGSIVWWSVKNVDILREKLIEVLKACGIDEKFARAHNYRAAFLRSLKEMEQNRIIRLAAKETSEAMVYQFTAETHIDTEDVKLQYDPETLVVVNKVKYRETKSIEESITGRADIRQKLIDLFDEKKDRYHSSDITRLIQRIFDEKADIISLRQTGGVYFVPSEFQQILQAVAQFVNNIGSSFEHFPLPDVEACRTVVANAANNEMMIDLKKMDEEMQLVESGVKEVTGKWHDNKAKEIEKLKKRIDRYTGLLSEGAAKHLTDNYEKMKEAILKPRCLDI